MAFSSSAQPSLVFGIEMEFLLRPKNSLMSLLSTKGWNSTVTTATSDEFLKNKNRHALRTAMAQALTATGIQASSSSTDYTIWTIADERSLDEVTGFWRIEFVSRIMSSADPWQDEINGIFEILLEYCDILLTKGCSTHIHVSPSSTDRNRYTLDQLVGIMKAIAYFDGPITKIMPATRKKNSWAESNILGDAAPKALKDAYLTVPTATWKPLFSIFTGIRMRQQAFAVLGSERSMSWNFGNVEGQCGTVEFRRPPGVRSAAEAKHWIAFTLGFIFYAMKIDLKSVQDTKSYPPVDRLVRFVRGGLAQLEQASQGAIINDLMMEDHSTPTVWTAAELENIKRKKAEKQKMQSVFVQKANSRPNTPV